MRARMVPKTSPRMRWRLSKALRPLRAARRSRPGPAAPDMARRPTRSSTQPWLLRWRIKFWSSPEQQTANAHWLRRRGRARTRRGASISGEACRCAARRGPARWEFSNPRPATSRYGSKAWEAFHWSGGRRSAPRPETQPRLPDATTPAPRHVPFRRRPTPRRRVPAPRAPRLALPALRTDDRTALDLQARAEALQPRAAPAPMALGPSPRRATGESPLSLASMATICRAAANQADPAAFIARLSAAYALSADDAALLRANCTRTPRPPAMAAAPESSSGVSQLGGASRPPSPTPAPRPRPAPPASAAIVGVVANNILLGQIFGIGSAVDQRFQIPFPAGRADLTPQAVEVLNAILQASRQILACGSFGQRAPRLWRAPPHASARASGGNRVERADASAKARDGCCPLPCRTRSIACVHRPARPWVFICGLRWRAGRGSYRPFRAGPARCPSAGSQSRYGGNLRGRIWPPVRHGARPLPWLAVAWPERSGFRLSSYRPDGPRRGKLPR